MDPTRNLSQIGQENPRVPSSSDLEDELFQTFFDWKAYIQDTEPLDVPSHLRPSPQHLNKLITEIPPLIDSLESHSFFRMRTSFGSDDPSEYSGHPSPPELVQGEGSTSPSDHSGPILPDRLEESQQRPDVSLGDFRAHDDKWTYPQTDPSKGSRRAYSPKLQVQNDGSTRQVDQGFSLKRRRSERFPEKRARQLTDPEQTADVRKSGACLPCRVSKTRCHEYGVCPTCRKAFPDHSHLVCTRMNLAEAWPIISKTPDVWSLNPSKEENFRSSPRFFTGKPREISIFFSRDPSSPPLRAFVQAYRWNHKSDDGKLEKAAFARDFVPSHEMLQSWVENQVQYEQGSDFQQAVQTFLLAYSHDGYGLPRHSLVTKVHKMACFFRIWKTSSFWCRDPSGKVVNLPISVQAELRKIVLHGIHLLENDVFKELDDCVTPTRSPKPDDKMALWASMWQLILIYRDLMAGLRLLMERVEQTSSDAAPQTRYKFPLESFFPVMAIFYHYHFKMKKSVEVSMDWLKAPAYPSNAVLSKRLHHAAKELIDCRKDFLKQVQKSENEVDKLLCIFVVNHELNKLNARNRTTKLSKTKNTAGSDDCDNDD